MPTRTTDAARTTANPARHWLAVVVLVLLVVAVEWVLGWGSVLSAWAALEPEILAIGILAVFASYLVRAWRLFDFFPAEMRGRFVQCTTLSLLHNLLNNLLPMRTGEASLPILLKRDFAIGYARGVATLLYFRLLDLAALACIAASTLALMMLDGAAAVMLMVLLFALPILLLPWLRPTAQMLLGCLPQRLRSHLQAAVDTLPDQRRQFSRGWWLTVCNWLAKLAAFAWLLTEFMHISLAAGIAGAIGGELSSVLPVHGIAGAGTYEAGILAGLVAVDTDTAGKLAAAINLHLFVLSTAILAGLAAWLIRATTHDT